MKRLPPYNISHVSYYKKNRTTVDTKDDSQEMEFLIIPYLSVYM